MKKLLIILLAICLTFGPKSTFAKEDLEAISSPQDLYINGQKTSVKGFNIKDYNYYKLRDLARILKIHGTNFSLWGDEKEIVINLNKSYDESEARYIPYEKGEKRPAILKEISLKIIKEDKEETIKTQAYNIDGYNYFKLRDMAKTLNYEANYDAKKNRALIATNVIEIKVPEKGLLLGNERLLEEYENLIKGKKLGLITNQTGIDSKGVRTVDKLFNYKDAKLVAIYSPEHGLDGKKPAGEYVESYLDEKLLLPIYSLYGKTREPSLEMLKGVDTLIFDIQDIGSRTYTYISTMNYAMKAAKKAGISFIVLDRPNPLGGDKVEGYVLEDKYKTFVGVDKLPMAHGMTIGELAKFFNREIGVDLTVVEMKGYKRSMIWQDTKLPFPQTSPNIPNLESAFNYMATGIGDGTGLAQKDKFLWVGLKGLNSIDFANILNSYDLPGVKFKAEDKNDRGGVRLTITDYHKFNPQLTGTYILATANLIGDIKIPEEENGVIPMFEKVHGSNKMGQALKDKKSPEEIVREYQAELAEFKALREAYLIYKE